jgi:hypothetical protein
MDEKSCPDFQWRPGETNGFGGYFAWLLPWARLALKLASFVFLFNSKPLRRSAGVTIWGLWYLPPPPCMEGRPRAGWPPRIFYRGWVITGLPPYNRPHKVFCWLVGLRHYVNHRSLFVKNVSAFRSPRDPTKNCYSSVNLLQKYCIVTVICILKMSVPETLFQSSVLYKCV